MPPATVAGAGASLSIVVPAHNEERAITRLLAALTAGYDGLLQVVVVCNGCSDRTAEVARAHRPPVTVIELAEPSKAKALRHGDEFASIFPRAYIDADVVVDGSSLTRLRDALAQPGVHACGPERRLELHGAHPVVRWYYDVWQRLPQVRAGLFGRGVVVVDEHGWRRLRALPEVMSDDLAMSEAFEAGERQVVAGTEVLIRGPRTVRDLVRRRARVATGNAQADDHGLRGDAARTTVAGLLRLGRSEPRLALKLPVFVVVALLAKRSSRQAVRSGDFDTWLRDDSSRD
jgi:hypothetical protein